ncbi:MAG: type II toxin-antitoxin system RelB/DinJ family antitoxin [Candidatus Paceibacterota bacterium]
MVNKTLFSIRTDKKLKKEAQATARELGLPLSLVINRYLRQFVEEKQVTFSSPLKPNAKTKKILDEISKDIKENKHTSKPFHNWVDIKAHLDSLKK